MRRAFVFFSVCLAAVATTACDGVARSVDLQPQTVVESSAVVAYQRFFTEPNGALFTNLLDEEVTGIRVTFSGPVAGIVAFGFYATAAISKNESGVVVVSGSIPPGGMVNLQWPSTGPQISKAERLDGSRVVASVDVHAPVVRIVGSVNPVTIWPLTVVRIDLDAFWSYDPDGNAMKSFTWAWSDGITQEGVAVTRGVTNFRPDEGMSLDVTMTVTDVQGETASQTLHFAIPAPEA